MQTVYLTSQPDYYDKSFNNSSYLEYLTKISNKEDSESICLSNTGITLIGRIQYVVEVVKG